MKDNNQLRISFIEANGCIFGIVFKRLVLNSLNLLIVDEVSLHASESFLFAGHPQMNLVILLSARSFDF